MTLNGWISSIPRERDKTNVYTLVDSGIKRGNLKLNHHLKIVDVYIKKGCPKTFEVEPDRFGIYNPDIYMYDEESFKFICIEVQLTQISEKKKMQTKVNQFVSEYDKHKSRIFCILSNHKYTKLKIDDGFIIFQKELPEETKLIKPHKKATL